MSRLTRDGTAELVSRDQILSRERGQGNINFPVQLTTCRIGSLARLIHTLAICVTIHGIAFRVDFSITTTVGALIFVRGLFLSVVRCLFTVVVGIKWIQEAAVRYHAQYGTP